MTHHQGDFFTMLRDRHPDPAPTTGARHTDPETSKAASQAVQPEKRTELQRRILRAFEIMGDMDDQALLQTVHMIERNLGIPEEKLSSPSGVRSRRSELAKPNMERLTDLAVEICKEIGVEATQVAETREIVDKARERLRIEGFRSPLWDTGRRVFIKGSYVIVWGVAK